MHFVQADPANSSDNENAAHEEDEGVGMCFLEFQQVEEFRRIGCANGRSTCDEALGQLHPPTASLEEDEEIV
jgi:protein-arginine kinase activator protein McsA